MKESTKQVLSYHFSATHIAYMALFTALAFVISFFHFSIFPAAPFLELDFSNVFFMIEGFLFGPVEAVVSIGIKELLCLMKSSTGGVGELANFLMSTAYVIVPAILYRFKKGRWWVAVTLVMACVLQMGVSLPVNRYINFPFFVPGGAAELFGELWPYVLAFNAVKSVVISLAVALIYKPLSHLIKATRKKLEAHTRRVKAASKAEKTASEAEKAQKQDKTQENSSNA